MSASASKKKRKDLEAQGLSRKEIHAKKETDQRKKKTRNILLAVLAVLLVAAIVVGIIMLANHRYRQNVATVGDQKISLPVYNCFYNSSAIQMFNYYSQFEQYGITSPIKAEIPFSSQANPDGEGTLEDYVIDYTNSQLQSTYILYSKALADSGFQLSQDGKDSIASALNSLKDQAKNSGYSDVDAFLSYNIGRGVKLADYETFLTVSTTVSEYNSYLQTTFAPSAEELAAAYNEDPNAYDIVTYTYSDTNAVAKAASADQEENSEITDEDRALAKEAAEKKEENMPEDAKNTHVQKANISNKELVDWLFDAARKEGDVKTFQMDDAGNSYRTVRFDSRDTNDYKRVTAYVIAIQKDKEEAPADDKSEATDGEQPETPDDSKEDGDTPETEAPETEAPAEDTEQKGDTDNNTGEQDDDKKEEEEKPTAEETLAKITEGLKPEMTDEEFAAYVKEQYKEVSSTVVDKSDYPAEVNDYLFAADRKAGDYETITTEDTYYVVRYVSTNEDTYRNEIVKSALYNKMYEELMATATIDVDKKVLDKYGHTDLTFHTSAS